jgi:hypothetical protein
VGVSTVGIQSPKRLRRGRLGPLSGTYWAWPVDGYFDLHFVADIDGREDPDGSDVIAELLATIAECRAVARDADYLAKFA